MYSIQDTMKVNKNWKNIAGVYKITFRNRCYIGSSKNLYDRLAQHISHLRGNKHHSKFMQRCFNKYGESEFNIEIIDTFEYEEKFLRERELFFIKELKAQFNSTTPIEYNMSQKSRKQISKTLKLKYKKKLITNPRLDRGSRISIYNFKGELIHKDVLIKEAIKILNISNRSVLNNSIRVRRAISCKTYIIIPENRDLQFLYDWINKKGGKDIPLYKITKDGEITRCTSSSIQRVLNKVYNSPDFMYYSNKTKSYYTFIGNIIKCPFYKKL